MLEDGGEQSSARKAVLLPRLRRSPLRLRPLDRSCQLDAHLTSGNCSRKKATVPSGPVAFIFVAGRQVVTKQIDDYPEVGVTGKYLLADLISVKARHAESTMYRKICLRLPLLCLGGERGLVLRFCHL